MNFEIQILNAKKQKSKMNVKDFKEGMSFEYKVEDANVSPLNVNYYYKGKSKDEYFKPMKTTALSKGKSTEYTKQDELENYFIKEGFYKIEICDDENVYETMEFQLTNNKLLILGVLIGIILIGGLCYTTMLPGDTPSQIEKPDGNRPSIFDSDGNKNNQEEVGDIKEELNKQINYLNIKIASYISFDKDGYGNFMVTNNNEGMIIQIILYPYDRETKTVDYSTKYYVSTTLYNGDTIGKDKLCIDLEPGKYSCVAMYNVFADNDNNTYLGSAGQEIVIEVQ